MLHSTWDFAAVENSRSVFRDTRMPAPGFENLEAGATIEEVIEQFDVTREQINAVLEFSARSPVSVAESRLEAQPLF